MIEKSLITMIFLYAASFGILGAQYIMADSFYITLTNCEGVEIHSNLLEVIDVDNINTVTGNLNTLNQTTVETNPITAAAELVWEILTILTGTYVFNVIFLVACIPPIMVAPFVIIYAILLFRTLIAYLRGI